MLRRRIDGDIENKIITGMIISDSFLRDLSLMLPSLRNNFESSYADTVARWCLQYYKKYGKAPQGTIQDIYNSEKRKLKDGDGVIIAKLLSNISSDYEQVGDTFNADYLLDQATLHFKIKNLRETGEQLLSLAEVGNADDAEEVLRQYQTVARSTSGWIDPFSEFEIRKYYQDEQNKTQTLFAFPGKLGELIGEFIRGSLWAILGPAKRGKSFWLQEVALQAALENLQVAYISLEMNAPRMKKRMYSRMTAQINIGDKFIYPCFDCNKNQLGTCSKSVRTNDITLYDGSNEKPVFTPNMKYKPCIACRGTRDFVPVTWFEMITRDKFTMKKYGRKLTNLGNACIKNLRFKSYPAFSASISQIKADLQKLYALEGFVPDVLVVDYADITAPENSHMDARGRIDETWKMLKNMADEFHCLVFSASQSNRGSFDKKFVGQTDIAEDIRKIAHVDGMLSINQTPDEKRNMTTRIAVIAGRDDDFDQFKTCLVLQNLKLGQVLLDSEIIIQSPPKKKNEKSRAVDY